MNFQPRTRAPALFVRQNSRKIAVLTIGSEVSILCVVFRGFSMPRFSEAEFDAYMHDVQRFVVDECRRNGVPLRQLARATERVGEMNPALFAFDDGGNAARGQLRKILLEEGMTEVEADKMQGIMDAVHDRFKDLIAGLVYNTFIPGPTYDEPPEEWPETIEAARGNKIVLGDFDAANLLGDIDDDGVEVIEHRFVNPCVMTVVGPSGAPVDYALPGWSCVLAGIVVVAGAIGDPTLSFLKRIGNGFEKTGRELKRMGKRIRKAFKF